MFFFFNDIKYFFIIVFSNFIKYKSFEYSLHIFRSVCYNIKFSNNVFFFQLWHIIELIIMINITDKHTMLFVYVYIYNICLILKWLTFSLVYITYYNHKRYFIAVNIRTGNLIMFVLVVNKYWTEYQKIQIK